MGGVAKDEDSGFPKCEIRNEQSSKVAGSGGKK